MALEGIVIMEPLMPSTESGLAPRNGILERNRLVESEQHFTDYGSRRLRYQAPYEGANVCQEAISWSMMANPSAVGS